jgi:hypothetical protein
MFAGNHRLAREVHCLRLTHNYFLTPNSERIRFSLDEPMSVARPSRDNVEVVGYAELPISWDEP